ncbi:MAG TPA: amino acid adenylation domain-containing protein [Pyrinomonadaceae bacterium]|nr:amino acid adenylation domain-containing protein [Pyrinomonadaceae bacterium]
MRSTVRQERPTLPIEDQLVVVAPAKSRLEPRTVPASIPPREDRSSVPLSFAQERYWFLEQISPGDVSLNISRAVRIKGDLRQDLLEQSLTEVINRHESLRTTFAINQIHAGRDSKPVPMITANSRLEISLTDLSSEAANNRAQTAESVARAAAQRPFDLTLGPLLRVALIKLDEREHVMLLSAHRIVCDETSLQILFEELWSSYSENQWTPPALAIQYADYAAWQRNSLAGESTELEFWRTKLHGAPAVIELPTDRPRPAIRTWHGQSTRVRLENELVDHLRRITAAGSSLDVLMLAALKVVLSRHSRQHDIVVGQTISNRDHAEHLVGPISNHLAVRSSLEGEPTFFEFLSRVQHNVLEAHAHTVPFEKLLEELQLQPGLSHTPVFQVSFQWQTDPGLELDEFEFDDGISRFDLMLEFTERPTHLDCRFRFSTDLFDDDTIARLATHLQVVLEGIVSNPNQKISVLPLLAPSERRQILDEWNRTESEYRSERLLHELFEEQAARNPEQVAVVFGDEALSYGELNRKANQLAHYLKARGVGPEVLVGVCIERSLIMVVGLLGILKAGGAYVALDPAYPAERVAFMLEDSNARVVLTEEKLLGLLGESGAEHICLDRDWKQIEQERETNPERSAAGENLAYVIYTSGSTGRPKGVGIAHRSTAALLAWARTVYSPAELNGVLASTSICFDLSVFELFVPLSYGGHVVLVRDVMQLLELDATVKLVNTVPSAMAELVRLKGLPETVQTVNLAGEPLAGSLVDELYRTGHVQRVVDLYGPSEDTTYSTHAERAAGGPATIGRPIANSRVYLLDAKLEPVPVGVAGELYLGGAGLARGYLNRPELTAQSFVPDPFSARGGERLYRTGDLARYRADGNLEYLGRIDNQVKVRGFRIELGEIETVLCSHNAVENVAVVSKQGKLLAYVVVIPEARTDLAKLWSELRSFSKTKLPEYMTPAIFVALDALPLTPNGKVDRRALPNVDESRPDLEEPYVGPRDQIEERLTTLWKNVLQLKSIGVRDNFFELGGNSLLAARLFAQIANSFGKHLPLATLFLSPTIEQLANCLRDSDTSKTWSSLVAIQPQGSKPPLFCVHAAGANVLIYRPLSRHLGNDQPVYALQAQGLDGRTQALTRVEDMAALYIKEMRAVQPEGPYFLLGASFGGLVIYEMAQQLLAQNQRVALLAMLNTNCPVYSFAKRIRCHVGHLMEKGPREYAQEIVNRRFSRQVSEAKNKTTSAPNSEIQKVLGKDSGADESLVRTVLAIMAAEEQYVPPRGVYPGKITLFWARDMKTDFEDNRMAWRKLAGAGFEVLVVPGTHTSMREEPHVAELAAKLKARLTEE